MENESKKNYFKALCKQRLSQFSLMDLRVYGRALNVPTPTRLKKDELIENIILVLCGELSFDKSKRGAPIKNTYLNQEIPLSIEQIKQSVFDGENIENEQKTDDPTQATTLLTFSVSVEKLTPCQKRFLYAFLNSLENNENAL